MSLYIFGAGQVSEVLYQSLIKNRPKHMISGFLVDPAYSNIKDKFGLRVLNGAEVGVDDEVYVGVSYKRLNQNRRMIFERLADAGVQLPSLIDRDSLVHHTTTIGRGSWIQELNNLQCFVSVGSGVIMWSANHIGHHTTIGDFTFIASHVCIGGNVSVGSQCFFGVNSSVADNVKIGDNCIVGAGATVTSDIESNTVVTAVGSNARNLGRRIFGVI
jgi:sugar O-acyltransferase (sialic acid O-acetyltransferase NeuD family)